MILVKRIYFNEEQEELYDELKSKSMTTLSFKDFVIVSFHKEIERLKLENDKKTNE